MAQLRRADSEHRREERLGVFAVLLILGLLGFVSCRSDIRGALESSSGSAAGGGHLSVGAAAFRIAGNASQPISPGVMVPIDLRITNPHDEAMSVTGLTVKVLHVAAPNADRQRPCSVQDFDLRQVPDRVDVVLPPSSTRALSTLEVARASWPRVGMRNRPVNQDGCKGASLTLSYSGDGKLSS